MITAGGTSALYADLGGARLQIHLDTTQPVELVELTLAFSSFARQYRKFLHRRMKAQEKPVSDDDVKLYISEIRTSSIIAELAGATELFGAMFSLMDYTNIFMDYAKHWRDTIDFFRGLGVPPAPITKADCDDISDLCGLVAKNEGGALQLKTLEYARESDEGPKTLLRLTFTQPECIEAQRGAIREKQRLEAAGHADYPAVIMRLYQTNIGKPKSEGRTGDRAIIDDILPGKDLPLYFASTADEQKMSMLDDPYGRLFVVDVNVRSVNGEPRAYTVMRVREMLAKKEDAEE
jgi:hypothetical protein